MTTVINDCFKNILSSYAIVFNANREAHILVITLDPVEKNVLCNESLESREAGLSSV